MRVRLTIAGIVSVGTIGKIVICQSRESNKRDGKVFNDPIHGHIRVNNLCVKIIDTPQFQRLRYLKQLGSAYFVYPGAPHNRFEHSIGVYHLAGEFARTLQKNHSNDTSVEITDEDIQCIEIAGLCHDLGHGPFSHLFDRKFIPRVENNKKWTHEQASVDMLDTLINENPEVKVEFAKFDPHGTNLVFIKELINPPEIKKSKNEEDTSDVYIYKGRPKEKQFLYEIVSNKRNGIDVDKWDYFARDCHMLGIKNNFDHKRYMMFARVIDVEGEGKQICMRDKEANNLYNMYHTRANLYRTAYQHKVATGIDLMIGDILTYANDHIKIPRKNKEPISMSKSIGDMEAYAKLNDGILQIISFSADEKLKKSQDILAMLHSRKLYTCIGESIQRVDSDKDIGIEESYLPTIRKEIIDKMREVENPCGIVLEEEDIEIALRVFNYGMKNKDPIRCMRFYSKTKPNVAFTMKKTEVSTMLPETFEERVVTVYAKDPANFEKHQLIMKCFSAWCKASRKTPKMEHPKSWIRPGTERNFDAPAESQQRKAKL